MQEQPVDSKLRGISTGKGKQLTNNRHGCGLVMLRNNAEWAFYKMSENNFPRSEWSACHILYVANVVITQLVRNVCGLIADS
jgi:hypothetical protein